MNDIRLRGLAGAGTDGAGRKSPHNHAQTAGSTFAPRVDVVVGMIELARRGRPSVAPSSSPTDSRRCGRRSGGEVLVPHSVGNDDGLIVRETEEPLRTGELGRARAKP
jgi:hypothetical protein